MQLLSRENSGLADKKLAAAMLFYPGNVYVQNRPSSPHTEIFFTDSES